MFIFKLHKLKKRFVLFSLTLFIVLFTFLFTKYNVYKASNISIPTVNPINKTKIFSEESLIKKINNVNKLITLEIELSQLVTIDQSYGTLDILKKYKTIKFYSNCSYYVDLSDIKKEDLYFDKDLNVINLSIPLPKIYNVNIDKEKSKEENSENGFLRFGEIKLTTEDFKELELEVIETLHQKLISNPIFDEAKLKSKTSIENLIKDLISEDININISFK